MFVEVERTMKYDYIILGAGAAGLSLAYRMANDKHFASKRIAIVEKDNKDRNDRTWCFWEEGKGLFDEVVSNRWSTLKFYSKTLEKTLDIHPYQYKMISGLDFYNYTLPVVKKAPNITFLRDEVIHIMEGEDEVVVRTRHAELAAPIIFKSFPSSAMPDKKKELYVNQHFKGFVIRTKERCFDTDRATFMDFRIPQNGDTRFFYVLPHNARQALVEVAIFSNESWSQSAYDCLVRDYIQEYLSILDYEIVEEEFGVIPMTTFPFLKDNTKRLIHIGTGGGVVKPSSGYAFQRIQQHSDNIITCLKNKKSLIASYDGLYGRFYLYDKIFLHAMLRNGVSGEEIFTRLFKKQKASSIFKFLDQKTSFVEDLGIFTAPPTWPFTKSFFSVIGR